MSRPCNKGFFKNSMGNLLPTLRRFLGGLYNFSNFNNVSHDDMRKSDIFYRFEKRTADIASLQKLRGHVQKKSSLFGRTWHWCLHLHLDQSKFDLSSWVIPSVPMVKLKDWSSVMKVSSKTNKAYRRYGHFFHSNFYDTSWM